MWWNAVTYISIIRDTLTCGKCVCVFVYVCEWVREREAGNTGREWKHSFLAQKWSIVIHAVILDSILKILNVAINPHNILKTDKDADRSDFQLSCWFWGFSLCSLIFFVHICLELIIVSTCIKASSFSVNTCCVFHCFSLNHISNLASTALNLLHI